MIAEKRQRQSHEQQAPDSIPKWRNVMFIITIVILIVTVFLFFINLRLVTTHPDISIVLAALSLALATISIILSSITRRRPSARKSSLVQYAMMSPSPLSSPPTLPTSSEDTPPGALFFCNKPLPNPQEFFGRYQEREKLLSRVRYSGSTSIIGPKSIGKTWLLQYLQHVAPGEPGNSFRVGYLNAAGPGCATVKEFVKSALMALSLVGRVDTGIDADILALEEAMKNLHSGSRRIMPVLCIDDFEYLLQKPDEFGLDFLESLRAIAQGNWIVLIIASEQTPLDSLNDAFKTSTFFNIFAEITLKPFDRKEAEQFMRNKGQQVGFTPKEQTLLLEQTTFLSEHEQKAWYPARLQLAGQMLLEDKRAGTLSHPRYWQTFKDRLAKRYVAANHLPSSI